MSTHKLHRCVPNNDSSSACHGAQNPALPFLFWFHHHTRLTTGARSSATNPPAIFNLPHHLCIVSRQSSSSNFRRCVTSLRFSIFRFQLFIVNQQPPMIKNQTSIINQQQATINHQSRITQSSDINLPSSISYTSLVMLQLSDGSAIVNHTNLQKKT